jgi:hypothetical protein
MVALLQDWEKGNSSIKALPPPKKAERLIETTAFTSLKGWKAPVKLLTPVVSDVNYQEDVNGYFNTSFASKLQSSIVFEIIQILSDTFCVSQVRTVSLCLPVCYLSFSLFVFLSLFPVFLSFSFLFLSLHSSHSPVRPTGSSSKSISSSSCHPSPLVQIEFIFGRLTDLTLFCRSPTLFLLCLS